MITPFKTTEPRELSEMELESVAAGGKWENLRVQYRLMRGYASSVREYARRTFHDMRVGVNELLGRRSGGEVCPICGRRH